MDGYRWVDYKQSTLEREVLQVRSQGDRVIDRRSEWNRKAEKGGGKLIENMNMMRYPLYCQRSQSFVQVRCDDVECRQVV